MYKEIILTKMIFKYSHEGIGLDFPQDLRNNGRLTLWDAVFLSLLHSFGRWKKNPV